MRTAHHRQHHRRTIHQLPINTAHPHYTIAQIMLSPEQVWLAQQPVDMRCGIDKLTRYVTEHLRVSWQSEAAFIFCNKARSRIKLLRWDKHGVWLGVRRLHRGHFIWPRTGDAVWTLTPEQFQWLIKGIDWQQIDGQNLSEWQ